MKLYGGIEAGGTKFICAVADEAGVIVGEPLRFPTTTPEETIPRAIAFFKDHRVSAAGIASFGPVRLSDGSMLRTPKPGWQNVPFAWPVRAALGCPVGFDTDVNAAVLAETRWGAGRGVENCIYLTVGTGLGGGAIVSGRLVHGLLHPEMGHIRVPRHPDDRYPGSCPFHGDCLEGLACGKAMEERWGLRAETLPAEHPAWQLEAHYLALGLCAFQCTLSPQKVLIGGGVMAAPGMFEMVRAETAKLMAGYLEIAEIIPPGLGDRAGVLGAIALAMSAAEAGA